ncbi:hypothetical protein [Microbacterium aurantiacum]|uniref:hypothetical protein n=1 Tax=Microbacterium aurantiacum TaxID=162393 RepID=UPI0007DA943C|nr:hypothetical protein [Microbacterium chocolatum]ANG86880.1 hypothetical protein A8L33_15000 [Microbacterium chocolatum]
MRHEDEVWHRRPVWVLTGVAVVLAIVLALGATAVGTGFFGLFRAVPRPPTTSRPRPTRASHPAPSWWRTGSGCWSSATRGRSDSAP